MKYNVKMESSKLPERIVPVRLADRGVRLCGRLAVCGMERLRVCLCDATGTAVLEVHFFRDRDGLRFVEGVVSASLRIECQRCMEPMDLTLRSEIKAQLMEGTVGAQSRPGYEGWTPSRGPVLLSEFVEEELLLALPMVSMHADGQCAAGPWLTYVNVPKSPTCGPRPLPASSEQLKS